MKTADVRAQPLFLNSNRRESGLKRATPIHIAAANKNRCVSTWQNEPAADGVSLVGDGVS
jgi:hypothetical protein